MRPTPTRRGLILLTLLISAIHLGASCGKPPPKLTIDSPLHGTFTNASSVTVTGEVLNVGYFVGLTVNGIPAPPLVGKTYTVNVPLDPNLVFNPIVVELELAASQILRERVTLVVGDGVNTGFVPDGSLSPESLALRVAAAGLDQIAPIVESLSGDALDISSLIAGQNPIAQGSMSGVSYVANVVEVGFGGFTLNAEPVVGGIDTTVTISDFFLEVDLDLDWLGSCTLEVETAATDISGTYSLSPLAGDPSYVDVNLTSGITVNLGGFSSQFVSGICNDPLIGDIINLILGQGDIQALMQTGFEDNLGDPDGAGPLDAPIAEGIQSALAGISIAGPVGESLGGNLDSPISSILEEATGLTILADSAFTSTSPDPLAPDLTASYTVAEALPVFGATTPVELESYGMAFGISTSGLNQLLKTQIENGLLRSEITEFAGLPLTAGLFAIFIGELFAEDPARPLALRINPTMAPVFTGNPGPPTGIPPVPTLAELKIGALGIDLVFADTDETFLGMEVDVNAGVNLSFSDQGIAFEFDPDSFNGLNITIVKNTLGSDEATLQAVFGAVFPLFTPALASGLEAFPLPSFLGLALAPVEVSRMPGGFLGLFADLTQVPTTQIQNVIFSDLSSGDFIEQGGCWLREWRHRISGNGGANAISANLRGMLGADAGCTTNDANSVATASYRVNFDVVGIAGDQWTLDIDHSLLGAYSRISDGYNDGIGFQDGGGFARFDTDVLGTYAIAGGASGVFNFTPAPSVVSDGIGGSSTDIVTEFSGSHGVNLVGTGNASIQLDFQFTIQAHSDSNTAFPTANGDELAIRFGKNDTIDNNFTAGQYPGMGSRNIANDGHFVTVGLSVTPLP